jgi:hypothetical protein
MERLHTELKNTLFSEKRPTHLVIFLPEVQADLKKSALGITFRYKNFEIFFEELTNCIYFTRSTYNSDVIGQVLEKALGHGKFILSKFEPGHMLPNLNL